MSSDPLEPTQDALFSAPDGPARATAWRAVVGAWLTRDPGCGTRSPASWLSSAPPGSSAQPEIHGDGQTVGSLRAADGGSSHDYIANTTVRRLTPLECERLQGYPDGWTLTSDGKQQTDSARYKQLGNSIAVPVFEWVAHRLVAVASVCSTCRGAGMVEADTFRIAADPLRCPTCHGTGVAA